MKKNQQNKRVAFLVFVLSIALTGVLSYIANSPKKNFSRLAKAQDANARLISASSEAGMKQVTPAISPDVLNKYLTVEAVLLGLGDHYSLYFKDLKTNMEVSVDPTRSWIPASIIKSFVLPEAFRQSRQGTISLEQDITIKGENVVSTAMESDEYPRLREGTHATIRQLIGAMITQSDNTAYNTLLDILDRRNISATLRTIGITQTVVGEKLNLDDSQFQRDLLVAGRQPNTTTAKDLSTYFNLLYAKKIPDSDEILTVFKKQKFNNMLPALLPPSTTVAHKTGVWEPLEHDGGIIYKPDDPFSMIVLTNQGDPTEIAKLSRIAYFQTSDMVGKNVAFQQKENQPLIAYNRPVYYIDSSLYSSVLGANTDNKFPTVTAEDLGITSKDFNIKSSSINSIKSPLIPRDSIFYGIKRWIESRRASNATTDFEKIAADIQLSKNRLAEAKRSGEAGDISTMRKSLEESEIKLKDATLLAKKQSNNSGLLLRIKQLSDLHYSLLGKVAEQTSDTEKEKFIDTVYAFHEQNVKNVDSVVSTTFSFTPTRQKPIIGTVKSIKDNKAEVKLDDGSIKTVVINDTTPARSFESKTIDSATSVLTGSRIAIVGVTQADSVIVPQFILKDVPDQLPRHKEGVVVEIDPNKNTLKILDANGKIQTVNVDSHTVLKSTDTNVSLEGIKAGSRITVFGVTEKPMPTATITPTATIMPTALRSTPTISIHVTQPAASLSIFPTSSQRVQITYTPTVSVHATVVPTAQTTQTLHPTLVKTPVKLIANPSQLPIKATSITVINNGKGNDEKKTVDTSKTNRVIVKPTSIPPTSKPKVEPTKK